MLRFRRGILVFLVLILLPLAPARAEPEDDILWSGTAINRKVTNWRSTIPPRPPGSGGSDQMVREVYIRKITAFGNGYAREEVNYRKEYTHTFACSTYPVIMGMRTEITQGSSISVPKPFDVIKTDQVMYITFEPVPLYVQKVSHNSCDGVVITETLQLQTLGFYSLTSEDGEFSADSTEVWGRHTGYNINQPINVNETYGYDSRYHVSIYNLSGEEVDNPWFSPEQKRAFEDSAELLDNYGFLLGLSEVALEKKLTGKVVLGRAIMVVGLAADLASLADARLAKEPPDPNYTEIALPVTPSTSLQPIAADGDFSQLQADAFNALITNFQQGIGLGRVMIICYDRASGAQIANDNYWVEQQLLAARDYADQYADVLDARPLLMENLKQALQTDPDLPLDLTSEDLREYKYNLIANGLSAEQEQLLIEMGVDERGRAEILYGLILAGLSGETLIQEPIAQLSEALSWDPVIAFPAAPNLDPVARFPDALTDPALNQASQELATLLREYAAGEGWKIYTPLVTR